MAKKIVEIVEVQVFLSHHGVPEIVIADNGSQFISIEFNEPSTKLQGSEKSIAPSAKQPNRTHQPHHQYGGESVYR
jgi:hypothetical protein